MKPLKPFKQSPGLDGPASLKVLLGHYGKELGEAELAHLCNATPEKGTEHAGLMQAVKAIGAIPAGKSPANIDDLRIHVENDIPVLVALTTRDGDHYSVVYEVGKTKVYLMDPATESGIKIMPIEEFEAAWHDLDGADQTPVEHWMMTVAGL